MLCANFRQHYLSLVAQLKFNRIWPHWWREYCTSSCTMSAMTTNFLIVNYSIEICTATDNIVICAILVCTILTHDIMVFNIVTLELFTQMKFWHMVFLQHSDIATLWLTAFSISAFWLQPSDKQHSDLWHCDNAPKQRRYCCFDVLCQAIYVHLKIFYDIDFKLI